MAVSAVAGIGGVGRDDAGGATSPTRPVPTSRTGSSTWTSRGRGRGRRSRRPCSARSCGRCGTADSAIPDTLDERAALYRSTLDGRRVLVLLDNAHDAAQIRPLLPGTPGCAALVTSRVRMVDLAGAHLVDLDVMSPEEALQLFTRIVGAERVGAERDAALDVVAACGFLPLAIRIAASRLAARRTWTVSVLAAKLADERRRLDELQAGDLAVKATFELGYGQLEPAQARAFRLLGLADGPDISLAAAAALLDRDPHAAEDLLEALVDTSLVESAAPGRYRYHDLVRLYARACAERDEEAAARESALSRLLDFYLATAVGVYALERPGDRTVQHLEAPRYQGLSFTDHGRALDWLYSEAGCLLACVRQNPGPDSIRRAVDLLLAAKDLAESGANARQFETAATVLRDAAVAVGDPHAEARARTTLAQVHSMAGRFDQAEDEARRAMLLAPSIEDVWTHCNAPNELGIIAGYRNRQTEAEELLGQACAAFRADGNQAGEASALCNLSRVRLAMGRTDSAVRLAEEGVALYNRMGLTLRLANGRYALGLALARANRPEEAEGRLTEALAVFRESRQRLWEGMTLFRLAEVQLTAERPAQAAPLAEQALTVLLRIGGEWRRANVLTVLGRALHGIGQADRAQVCWQEALSVFERLDAPESESVARLLSPAGFVGEA
ncbi:tetratricopeptide repeat protein [Streptomyces californicus]